MLIKLNMIISSYARHLTESTKRPATQFSHQQWIMIDRIVIAGLFIAVIIATIAFS